MVWGTPDESRLGDDGPPPISSQNHSRTARFLVQLAALCHRRPAPVLFVGTVLCLFSILVAAAGLRFEPDRGALVGAEDEYHLKQLAYNLEFPYPDDMLVIVEGGDAQERKRFVDELASRLSQDPGFFQRIFGRLELPFLTDKALYLLGLPSLKKLVTSLEESRTLLNALSDTEGLSSLLNNFNTEIEGTEGTLANLLPFLNEILSQLYVSLQTRGRFEYNSPWAALFFGEQPETEGSEDPQGLREPGQTVFYNTLADGQIHLLLLQTRPDAPGDPIQLLRTRIAQVRKAYPGLRVGLTGESVLEYDEMRSSAEDSGRSALLSLFLVTLLFAFGFRQVLRPAAAIFALLVGIGWTVGFTTLAIGHLNLLTVSFATLLVGLGVDYGIHIIYRYDEELGHGYAPLEAMQQTMAGTGVENLTGAISTAVAFWAVGLTDFRGVAELGIIAGTGVFLCFVSMVTMLPSLLFLLERDANSRRRDTHTSPWLRRLENRVLSRPWWVVLGAAAVTLLCLSQLVYLKFDFNLLRMQAPTLDSVQTELRLIHSSDRTILSGAALADGVEEARVLAREFEKLPTVSHVESVAALIPARFEEKTPYMVRIQQILRDVEPPPGPSADGEGGRDLQEMAEGFLDLESAFQAAYPTLMRSEDPEVRAEAQEFKQLLDRMFSTLERMGPGPIEDGLSTFQRLFFDDLREMITFLKSQSPGEPIELEDLPRNLLDRSVGRTGKLLLRIYPRYNIWEREPMERFVHDLRTVDKEAIGAPVMMLHHSIQMKRAFETSGTYAFLAICLLLMFHFRSAKKAFLALLPLLVGVSWMLGAMVYWGVDFNLANFMALPLILGIGLDFGIHVVHRTLEEGSDGMFSNSTGPATALSGLTTIAGFGTLSMAHHQGIASLGFVLTAGVAALLVASLVVLPAVLRVIRRTP